MESFFITELTFLLISFLVIWLVSYLGQTIALRAFHASTYKIVYLLFTSFGVIFHELSHALMAMLFRHNIKEIVFFKPDPYSSSLGYVSHSYNLNSIYQSAGNFWIGFAPLFMAPLYVLAMAFLFLPVPGEFIKTISGLNLFNSENVANDGIKTSIQYLVDSYTKHSFSTVLWFYMACSISLSCGPSPADIKASLVGVLPNVIFLLILCLFFKIESSNFMIGSYILLTGLCLITALSLSGLHLLIKTFKYILK